MTAVICGRHDCSELLPPGRHRYCSDRCRATVGTRRYRAKRGNRAVVAAVEADARTKPSNVERIDRDESTDGRASARGGPGYDRFVETGWAETLDQGLASQQQAAEALNVPRAYISRWMAHRAEQLRLAQQRAGWERPAEAEATLGDFVAFRERYFRTPDGEPYHTRPYHARWITATLDALDHGGQLAILSPPRHGKTDLMAHFVVWLIVRNPNIRIIWVGGNEDIGDDATGVAFAELNDNQLLAEDFLGPGGTFRPGNRTGKSWRPAEFTVATRTIAMKSPTVVAVGRGGKLLSRDADLILCDDLEDDRSTAQPAQRTATKRWFSKDVASRKQRNTAWIYIGSRQHPEDLAGDLVGSPAWDSIVESAHDPACALPWDPPPEVEQAAAQLPRRDADRHIDRWLDELHSNCVLFPEVNPFSFLRRKRHTVGEHVWAMQWQNAPDVEGLTHFPRDVVEACRDRSRTIGDIPPGCRLIAGLDPATKGYQAAILWAVHVDTNTRFLVDLQNEKAGGTPHLRAILADWPIRYGVTLWCIEQNIVDDVLRNDTVIRDLRARLNLRFVDHLTSASNKFDKHMGVTSMVPLFERGLINLPYGDAVSQQTVEPYINQLVNYADQRSNHMTNWPTDLVMAGWFPEKTIQSWQHQQVAAMAVDYDTAYPFRPISGW